MARKQWSGEKACQRDGMARRALTHTARSGGVVELVGVRQASDAPKASRQGRAAARRAYPRARSMTLRVGMSPAARGKATWPPRASLNPRCSFTAQQAVRRQQRSPFWRAGQQMAWNRKGR